MTWRLAWAAAVLFLGLAAASPAKAVIGGIAPPAGDPSALATVILLADGHLVCSATVVGPRAVLTMGFCTVRVQDNQQRPNAVVIDGKSYAVTCGVIITGEGVDAIVTDIFQEIAICTSDLNLPVNAVASISAAPSTVVPNANVDVYGVGCLQDGEPPKGPVNWRTTSIIEARDTVFDIAGDACGGDAGGGVFFENPSGPVLLGLVSTNPPGVTQVASVSSPIVQSQLKLLKEEGLLLCGISEDPAACKTVQPGGNDAMAVPIGSFGEIRVERRLVRVSGVEGETFLDLVNRVCGHQPDDYFDLASALGLGPDETMTGSAIDIPICSFDANRWFEEQTIGAGEVLWDIFEAQDEHLLDGTPRWLSFKTENRDATDPLNNRVFLDAFIALNPNVNPDDIPAGTPVLVPLAPPRVGLDGEIDLHAPGAETVTGVSEGLAQLALSDYELQNAQSSCEPPETFFDYPYDLAALLRVLWINRAEAPDLRRDPTTVLIGDSGLFGAGRGIFPWRALNSPGAEDERLRYAESILPVLRQEPKMAHGTQVASLVLGGAVFARLQGMLEGGEMVIVVPRGIYKLTIEEIVEGEERRIVETFVVDEDAFDRVMDEAKSERADIVNLSLKTREPIPELEAILKEEPRQLFVVAAGNGDGTIGDSGNDLYPAMNGAAPNVLVVGALDGKRGFASFSNSHPTLVQIAAPGCSVPVISFDADKDVFIEDRQNGTSLATPVVSFTAAIVQSEAGGRLTPQAIKRRLLASADLDSLLAGFVEDGRILNVPAAAAVQTDVLKLANRTMLLGDVTITRGGRALRGNDILRGTCENDFKLVAPIGDIVKIAPGFRREGNVLIAKVYVNEPGLPFRQRECHLTGVLGFTIVEAETQVTRSYRFDEVADFVPRLRADP